MASTCDILVIGGGALGVSAAWHLVRRQAGRIMLLERAYLGAGGSGQRAPCLSCHEAGPALAGLLERSLQAYEIFPETVGAPAIFARTGLILISGDQAHVPSVRPVTELELVEIDSNAHLGEGEVAYLDAEAGTIDAVQMLAGYAEGARQAGVELREGVEVREILVNKGRVTGVETNEGTCACGSVVVTAGAWSPALVRKLGVALPIRACRSPCTLFRRPPNSGRRSIPCVDRAQGMSFLPTPTDLLLAVGTISDESESDAVIEPSNEAVTGEWLALSRQRLSRRYPPLHRAYGRGGFRALAAITADGLPIVDRLPGIENAFCAAGFGTQDVSLAVAAGELLTDLVLGVQTTGIDSALLGLARFEKTS